MEVRNPLAALLSNYEVYDLLKTGQYANPVKKEKKHGKDKVDNTERKISPNVVTVTYEVIKYLEDTLAAKQTAASVEGLLRALQPYNLTRGEKMMILNLGLTSEVDLHVFLEECEERLTDDQIQEVIRLVKSFIPESEGSKAN